MMQESSTGKVFEIWGGKFGYESREVFWTDVGEFRSQHVHLGPIELVHHDAKTSPARYQSPASLGLRVGTWSTATTLESGKQAGVWIGLVIAFAIAAGIWRKRTVDRRLAPASASEANK